MEVLSNNKKYLIIFLECLIATSIILLFTNHVTYDVGDASEYLALANGDTTVVEPFSNRILHVYIVKIFSALFNIDIEKSFFIIGILSLSILFLWISYYLKTVEFCNSLMFFLIIINTFTLYLFQSHINPDLFYTFIISGFIFALFHNKKSSILFFIPLLFLTRESTVLIIFILGVICYIKKDFKLLNQTLFASIIGIILINIFNNDSTTNIHGLNGILYLPLKFIFNFLFNIFGVELYSNTFNYGSNVIIEKPVIITELPKLLQLGNLKEVGIMSFEISKPIEMFFLFLTYFGAWPMIAYFSIKSNLNKFNRQPVWLLFVIIYGSISFIMTPILGSSIYRLIGYSWPIFWIGLPFLLKNNNVEKIHINRFIYSSFIICWTPFIFAKIISIPTSFQLLSITSSIIIYTNVYSYITKNNIFSIPINNK